MAIHNCIEYTVKVYMDITGWYLNRWYLNNKLHRENGPAIEYADGSREWWLNGELHRKDGPAIEDRNGYKAWFLNGKRHREDGPAIENSNGYKAWYLNDTEYSELEWEQEVKEINNRSYTGKVVEIDGKKYKLVEEN